MPAYQLDAQQTVSVDRASGFERIGPLWLEIGFGNGDVLINLAHHNPEINFIGAEVHPPGVGRVLNAVHNNGSSNVRLVDRDAVAFLSQQVDDGALQRVLLFFPDPWHKKRHHKRRIVNVEFAELVAAKLQPGGVFHAATDWREYAEHMLAVLDACPQLHNQAGDGNYAHKPHYRVETRFERRGQQLGHGVWDLLYQRRPTDRHISND